MDAGPVAEDLDRRRAVCSVAASAVGDPAEIEREDAEQHGAEDRRHQNDAPAGEPGGKARADRDGDREDREVDGHDVFGRRRAYS